MIESIDRQEGYSTGRLQPAGSTRELEQARCSTFNHYIVVIADATTQIIRYLYGNALKLELMTNMTTVITSPT